MSDKIRRIELTKEVGELLEEIQEWMVENDYECGPWGSQIYKKISKLLGEIDE